MKRAAALAAALCLLAAPAAAGQSFITLNQPAPRVGDQVTFTFSAPTYDGGRGPWLQLQCYRAGADLQWEGQLSGVLILSASLAGFPGGVGYGEPFVLASPSWHEGPADCVAQVGHKARNGRWVVDAETRFHVSE